MEQKKPKWKKVIPTVLWSLAGMALCILLVSAVQRNNQLHCRDVDITIAGFKNEMFISEADVQGLIEEEISRKIKGCSIQKLELRKLENRLQKNNWISKAELFIDNRQVLHVQVSERLPVARIFTVTNNSFYIDSSAVALPLSPYEIADVPVFTNVPDRGKVVTPTDSIFWQQLSSIGNYISNDSFLLMQIGQINITPEKELEMYPVIGNHVVRFGTPENYSEKFKKLQAFYTQILAKAGLNKYAVVDVRFNKQIVAKLRNASEVLPYEPAINVQTDMLAATLAEERPETVQPLVAKGEEKPEKKQEDKLLTTQKKETIEVLKASPKKESLKKQTAKTEVRKPAKEREKIVAASNNKPDKKAIQQLPVKKDNSGIIEVDLKKKPVNETKSIPRAVMPKKQ